MIGDAAILDLTCRALGVWGTISALQWWASRDDWRHGGPLGWDLLGLKRYRVAGAAALADAAFAPASIRIVIAMQLVSALGLAVLPLPELLPLLLTLLLLSTWLLCLRSVADGADKMALVVTMGALLQCLPDARAVLAGQAWIAGQLVIAYCTSGATKLRIADWRSGAAPTRAMASRAWGHPVAARVLAHRKLALAFAWTLMLVELAFPLVLLAPPGVLLGALALFFAFHLATAVFMGLNTYPWAFLAAYPATFAAAEALRGWLA